MSTESDFNGREVITERENEESQLEENQVKEEQPPQFDVRVSTDNMAAYLKIKQAYSGQKVSYDDVSAFLTQQGITYGICEEQIRLFCEEGKFYSEMLCAKGTYPVDGTDGSIDYFFNTSTDYKPKEREDGTIDFRDLDIVKNVKKDTVLCTITPPGDGMDGTDVFSHVVPFVGGRFPVLPTGNNTIVSEDGLSLIAGVDGCIEYKNSTINVSDVFYVRGDVDSASGNVNAIGSVVVMGDVREGFSVKAGKDISIRGMVEGALIEAQGTISISNGMNGMGRGTLKAGGNIVGKYFENAILISENDIYADILMNCKATAQGSIILKGRRGSLIGGSYQAGQKMIVKNIGAPSYTTTQVSIQSKQLNDKLVIGKEEDSVEQLEQKRLQAQHEFEEFQSKYLELTAQASLRGRSDSGRENLIVKAALMRKVQLGEAIKAIDAKIQKLKETKNELSDYKIVGSSIIYIGTKMTIGPFIMNINNDYSNTKFYAGPEGIVSAPVLLSDLP
jgi:Predicted polymerase, most proteins contain PALM domain, HD hydrolase domain and Zn-ribbon domain